MSKGTVVIDNDNMDAVLADAHRLEAKPEVKDEKKEEPKTEAKPEPAKEPSKRAESDDNEEEIDFAERMGISKEQHEAFTRIMKKALVKKQSKIKEAEEFATEQFNRRRAAEERTERLQRELEEAKKTKEPVKQAQEDGAPKRESFKSDQEYWEAVIDYRAEQKVKAREAELAQKEAEKARQQTIEQAKSRIDAAREIVPDFDEKMEALGDSDRVPDYIAEYMQESELLAEIAYYLASNTDVLKRLQTLRPAKALVEIGKIESTLKPFAKPNKPEAKEVEKHNASEANYTASEPSKAKPRAPEPIVPINTGSASQLEKAPEQMTVLDNIKAVQKQTGTNMLRRQRH